MNPVYPTQYKIYANLAWLVAGVHWVDITGDAVSDNISAGWGIQGNKPLDRLASTGALTFTLNNVTGKYSPDLAGALAGWTKGAPIKLVITYDGFDYVRFRGVVDALKITSGSFGNRRVFVTVLDWLDYAAKYPLTNPAIQTNKTADQALATIVAGMSVLPYAVAYDAGANVFPALFDTVTPKTLAYTEFTKLALSEPGYIYLKKDQAFGETLVFENYYHRSGLMPLTVLRKATVDSGFLLKEDGDKLLLETGYKIILDEVTTLFADNNMLGLDASYGDNLINRVTVTAYPKRIDSSVQVLYSLSSPVLIGSAQVLTFRGNYSDPTGGAQVNAISNTMIVPAGPGTDTYTKSLLHMNGAAASTTFTDESGKAWTAYGSAQIDIALSQLGGSSGIFNGSTDYVNTPNHADFEFGGGDFTIDWWEYRTNIRNGDAAIARDGTSGFPAFMLGYSDGTNLKVYMSSTGAAWDIANPKSLGAVSLNQWVHLAVVRKGNNFYCFKNGVQTDAWTSALALFANSNPMSIGRVNTTHFFTGHIDEVRVSKGIARWISNFTPRNYEYALWDADYLMNTAADGSGTDITANLTVSAVYGTGSVIYTLTNGSIYAGYIIKLQARGYGVYQYNPIETIQESVPSENLYGLKSQTLQQQYQRDLFFGASAAQGILDRDKAPHTILNQISLNANTSAALMQAFLILDVGDLVRIRESQTGIDGYYYIQGVRFLIMLGGVVNFGWIVKQSFSLAMGLTLMAAEFHAASTDGINYGYLPQVSNLPLRTFTAWIYPVSLANGAIASPFSDNAGAYIRLLADGSIRFYQKGVTGPGIWLSPAGAVSINNWHFIAVSRDTSVITNKPVIYIDGVSVLVTEVDPQGGATADETGANFVVGNLKTTAVDYTFPFDGKIKDARVYNRILSQADINTLHYTDAGVPGLVFQAPCVRTSEVPAYTNLTLTAENKLIDNIYGAIGTPNGSPISRMP